MIKTRLVIDSVGGKILNLKPDFVLKVADLFKQNIAAIRKELINKNFVSFPQQSPLRVISRSGKFRRSIKLSANRRGNKIELKAQYDRKYQTIEPDEDVTSVTIKAKDKKFLAIPVHPKLFNPDGSYKYDDIELSDESHPYYDKLRFRKNPPRLVNSRGVVFYWLKKSVKIFTKRPIRKADKKLLRLTQGELDKAFKIMFRQTFLG